jgi:hypothetical protein
MPVPSAHEYCKISPARAREHVKHLSIAVVASVILISCGGSGPIVPSAVDVRASVPAAPAVAAPPIAAPPIARLSVQIDKSGSTAGIAGYTPVLLDGSGSEGDHLNYSFDFGDGASTASTDSSLTHVFGHEGLFTVKLTVRDSLDRTSTSSAKVPCLTLLNAPVSEFVNTFNNGASRRTEGRVLGFESQSGSALRGYYRHPEGYGSSLTGTLSGDRALTIKLDDGTITFTGEVRFGVRTVPPNDVTDDRLVLAIRGGSADGQTLIFDRYLRH